MIFNIFCLFLFFHYCFSYNALFFSFHDSGSHQESMSKLFIKLAKSGNNITVVDTTSKNKLPNYGLSNIEIINATITTNYFLKYNFSQMWWDKTWSMNEFILLFNIGDLFFHDLIMEKSHVIGDILSKNYDVIIIDDLYTNHGLYITQLLNKLKKVPYIQYGTTFQLAILQSSRAQNHIPFNDPPNAGPLPKTINEIYNPQIFFSRLINFYVKTTELFIMPWLASFKMPTTFQMLNGKFNFEKHFQKSSMIFTEAFNGFGMPISQGNDVISIGAFCPIIGILDKETEDFINDPKSKGTILLALGSNVKWDLAPKFVLDAFLEAFEVFKDYRIIFSYNGQPRKTSSKHILLVPWVKQKEILNHPKTKVFISHSGLKSTNEAICAAVPLILMPSFTDQKYNSEFFVHLGYAEYLNKFHITKDQIVEALNNVLKNYDEKKAKMLELKSFYLDKMIDSMDLAEFYVKKVVKSYKNHKKLIFERKGMFLNWINYLNFDLFFVILFLIFISSK